MLFWFTVDLTVAIVVLALLLYRPGSYSPSELSENLEPGQVSPYLTHDLSPGLYNGAQRGEPFELVVTQDGINEVAATLGWPKMSQGIMLYDPAVLFEAGSVVLMGTADAKGLKFIITIVIEPKICDDGLLGLDVSKVKIGAMNITPLVRMTAEKMYAQKLAEGIDTEAVLVKILGALLNGEHFEPVFKIDGRKVRMETIAVSDKKLTIGFVPVP